MSCDQIFGKTTSDNYSRTGAFANFSAISAQVCNLSADRITTNFIDTTNVSVPENAIRVQLFSPFSQPTPNTTPAELGTPAGDYLQNNLSASFTFAEKYPLDNIIYSLGTDIQLLSPGDVQVLSDGVYTLSYTTVFTTYDNSNNLLSFGIPGNRSDINFSVSGTVINFLVINNVLVDATSGYAHDYFNFQTIQPPLNSGSVTLPLQSGDIVSVYSYATRNATFQNAGIITTRFCDFTVSKVI